ncbi:MAG: GntR family transcriptional regulator [Gemmatimonadales bacterium]|nr:GntR family transcriptional regulator [Gemmatimonadota bacterium]MCL4214651.1 GntR family transcriptional regulator [Gemmatimonadales bacterium]
MITSIDPGSPTPIYAQIADRVRVAVASGELTAGTSLPSVRALASRLRVNPATVVQAYRELERDGIVEMRQGAGTFVAEVPAESRARERTAAARRFVRQMLTDAARLGLSPTDLRDALDRELPESK